MLEKSPVVQLIIGDISYEIGSNIDNKGTSPLSLMSMYLHISNIEKSTNYLIVNMANGNNSKSIDI